MNITDPDLTALVAGVLADVNDVAPRAVLADYLEERGYSVLKWGQIRVAKVAQPSVATIECAIQSRHSDTGYNLYRAIQKRLATARRHNLNWIMYREIIITWPSHGHVTKEVKA